MILNLVGKLGLKFNKLNSREVTWSSSIGFFCRESCGGAHHHAFTAAATLFIETRKVVGVTGKQLVLGIRKHELGRGDLGEPPA